MLQEFDGTHYNTGSVVGVVCSRYGATIRKAFERAYRAYHTPHELCDAAKERIAADVRDYRAKGVLPIYVFRAYITNTDA